METGSAGSRLTPQVVNSQLASVDILSVRVIQTMTQILDHCMPNVPSGFYILSLVLKHLQRLCSKNLDTNGNNDLHVGLCNLLNKCLHSVANICDSEKFDALWNTFSQTLQKCTKGHREVCSTAVEILSLPLLDLTLSTSDTFSWQQKRDFLRLLREMLSTADRTMNQNVGRSLDDHLCKLTELFLTCGDYEYQTSIMEVIFRYISIYRSRKSLKHWFNRQEPIYVAFSNIKFLEFDVDCRLFVNIVNESLGNNRQVYSFACLKAYLGQIELQKPRDDKYKEFWIDFNKRSKTVSFYCEGNQLLQDSHTSKSSWKLIVIHRDMVKSAKLYKRNAVRSSRTGHCTVVIEFVKHDGNSDASSSILSQCYLKLFFDHTYQLSLSKDVLLPLFEEAFQELNSAKATSYRSSVTPLIPVSLFRTPRNRDSNKRMKVSVGEMTLVNQKKFEPLIIKKSSKHHTKEVSSAGSVQHGPLSSMQLHNNISHTSDEVPDTQSSSDPVKDLKGKLTEQFIENFTKRKMSVAISPQLSHVSEERLTEMGSAPCSMQSAQENNFNHNKPGKKLNKMSVSSQLCIIETKSRKVSVEDNSAGSGEVFEPVKLDSERGFTSVLSKSPRVLLKKLHFNETPLSWLSHTDVIKYNTTTSATTSTTTSASEDDRKEMQAELKSTLCDSISAKNATLSNNSVKINDCKDTKIKKTVDESTRLTSYTDRGLSDLQHKLQIPKAPKPESTMSKTKSKSLKPDDTNSLSDLDMFFQDETSGKQNTTPPNTVVVAIDNLNEQLRMLHNDNIMQPSSSKSFKNVNVQKEVVCNEKSAAPPSDIRTPENSNISRINLNIVTETQQTLIMVNSCKENETGAKKEEENCSTTQFDSHQPNATKETEIENKEIPSQRSHFPRTGISTNEIATSITDNGQKSKIDFASENKTVMKSATLVSKTSEALLADWEDNLDDGVSSKELYAISCIKTNVQGSSAEGKQLKVQKKVAGKQNNLQNESRVNSKELYAAAPIKSSVQGSSAAGKQLNEQKLEINKTTKKENCNNYPSEAGEVGGGSDERNNTKKYFKGFSSQKTELIVGSHSKNILASNSKGETNKCTKKDIVIHHLPVQGKKNYEHASEKKCIKNNSVTEISTVDTSFDISKVGKSNRPSKKRKLYTHSDSSTVISAQDFDDSNDTINDSKYSFMFARKKQRKSLSSKQRDKRQSLAGGIFSLENSDDSACNANEDKQKSLNSFSQSFQLNFSMNRGYNRWYSRYKEQYLQKYPKKQTKRSNRSWKDTSVYSDIESEDSALSWMPTADEKKSKRRNEKMLEHLNRTARKYERKKPSSKKFKISSHSFTFAKSNDPEPTSNKKILKLESGSKELLKNRKTNSLTEKIHGNPKATESSSDDDKHLRNVPLSMRLSLNKTKHHKQLNNQSKKDNVEKTNASEEFQEKSKKYEAMKLLDFKNNKSKLANAEDNCGSVQNEILSYHEIKSTFPSIYSKNNLETTEGLSARNEQAESLSGDNESFSIMEKKYCNEEDSTSSDTSENIFKRMQKDAAADDRKNYKNKQGLTPKDRTLNAVDLQASIVTSSGKTAKGKKKHSEDKPEVRDTFPLSLSQGKIVEKEKEIIMKSASEKKMEGTEELSARNEETQIFNRGNVHNQSLSTKNDTKENFQTIELSDDESYHDKRESFAVTQEKYCRDKNSTSSETSESIYVNRMQKKIVDRLKGYKTKQDLRPKAQALNTAEPSSSISYGKIAKGKKKHFKGKLKVSTISPHSLSQEKIAEEEKEILCSNEGSIFNVLKSSYLTEKNEMKVKKKHNIKHPNISDPESSTSSEEQENVNKKRTSLERDEGTRNITSSNKITKQTFKSYGHKSQIEKSALECESVNDEDVIASKDKCAYSDDLGPEYVKDTAVHIVSSNEDDDANDDGLKSNLQTNINKQILDYIKLTHNISDDLQLDYCNILNPNEKDISDNDGTMPGKNNSGGSKILSQKQFKFSKSSQSRSKRTRENVSKETIDVALNEQDAVQEILVSSGNENERRITASTSKPVSDESFGSRHESSTSTGAEINPRYHKSAENEETVTGSQDIFQYDENIDSTDSEVVAPKNKVVTRPKRKNKNGHSSSNDVVKCFQGNKVKHISQSPKQLSNISVVNSSFGHCFQDNKTDKSLTLQEDRQKNEQVNFLKGCETSVRLRQDPYCEKLMKKNYVIKKETSQYLLGTDDGNNASQSSTGSSVKRTHSKHKFKEKICPNQTTRNINSTVVTTTGRSKHRHNKHDSTDSAEMLQEKKHNMPGQSKEHHKNWYQLSQNSSYSLKTRRKIHKTKRKPSRKRKTLESKDDFVSEICLDIKASNASLTNEQCTAESLEEELENAEPCAKLMFRQKVLKHEFESGEFRITCTGDERAIAIEDGEGGVDMMVEKNTDLKLSSLLPWEDMKKLLSKKTGNLESYITSATEATQDHFINTCKEISASRQTFLKNKLQRMESEIKASEEVVMELNKQEEKFTKAFSYIEHAYQRQTSVEEKLESRFSAQKKLFQSPKLALQQKNDQNVLQKYAESLQNDLAEMQNHYYKEEFNEMRKKLQQRLMISYRIEDMEP